MKLLCIDRDECGYVGKIEDPETHICPICFGLAVSFSDNYTPAICVSEEASDEMLASIHNLFSILEEE